LISLGSNINPEKNLPAAIQLLSSKVENIELSSIWESKAVGSSGPNYLNSAALFSSNLSLDDINAQLISPIENQLGRVRSDNKYMDRTIDLDIILSGDLVLDSELWSQAHVALPASELLPDFRNKESGDTLLEIAERLKDNLNIFQRLDLG
jgi:2-amino-4-hydroxy-6-hydroxymethyldihydropteridine diphosphokinase